MACQRQGCSGRLCPCVYPGGRASADQLSVKAVKTRMLTKTIDLKVSPELGYNEEQLDSYLQQKFGGDGATGERHYRLLRRSVDARGRQVKVNLQVALFKNGPLPPLTSYRVPDKNVANAPVVLIVGAGPAGMFAALRLVELGMKPVILERGKDVRSRRRDLAAINKAHVVNPESNYCFGEGGAGTYSDGKLYTRSKKRGNFRRVLEIFVAHGANPDILVEAHPHIGTNKLPKIVTAIRESIENAGGEVRFGARVARFVLRDKQLKGVVLANGEQLDGEAVILATGHSARDVFELMQEQRIAIEAKPFALGVRVEHPQRLIDSLQYHQPDRGDFLPAAAYSLVAQTVRQNRQKGVFSFCMCPGGFIVPAATAPGEVVVNGMSPSRRNSRFANSGIVVSVEAEDLKPYSHCGPLAGLAFQREVEQRACHAAGGTQAVPGQLLTDFVNRRPSTQLLKSSYQPGLVPVVMDEVLPRDLAGRLRTGFQFFGKKMRGYLTDQAQIVAVESRTSSPVKVPRHPQTCEHTEIGRLFPCGEGAGYAGGIASAAMDGERCASQVAALYGQHASQAM